MRQGKTLSHVRLAYGAVAATPMRCTGAEAVLEGQALDAPTMQAVAAAARDEEVFVAVKALPRAQQEVIQLRFGAGLSVAETAEALEKQQTNVKVLQHKGIKRLREILEAQAASARTRD